jgi:hypothetical protein
MPDIFNSSKEKPQEVVMDSEKIVDPATSFAKKDKKKKHSHPHPKDVHNLPGHSHNPLAAYCYYPDKVKFALEDPEEKIVLLLRKHPITNLSWIVVSVILAIIPLLFSVTSFFEVLPPGFQMVTILIWYMVTFAYAFEKFLTWFFNVNILTDERVIDVDFVHLLYREITDAETDQIQDVTVVLTGAIRTFFNFGDVLIQTAAETARIEFQAVPNPDEVAKILRELRIEEEKEQLEGRVR